MSKANAVENLRKIAAENKVWLGRHADLLEINGYHDAAVFLRGAAATNLYIPEGLLADLDQGKR